MTPTATLFVKPGKERSLLRRHPWLYAGAIDRIDGRPASGDLVRVASPDGRFLAWAAFSPASSLRARAWSFREQERPDEAWLRGRITESVARRAALSPRTSRSKSFTRTGI